jgi:hypothetical protein
VATCPGSLIVHADGTIAGCTQDDERDGCRGREQRHDSGSVICVKWFGRSGYCDGISRRDSNIMRRSV